MCKDLDCIRFSDRKGLAEYWGKSAEPEKEVTGETCVNVEYDGELVPAGWVSKSCGQSAQTRAEDCGHPTPAYVKREDENVCVDVYDDNFDDAKARLDTLLEQKVSENNWQNVKYYCMYGATEFFMSIFQPDSLAYSNKYCGKAPETAKAEPAVEDATLNANESETFNMMNKTRQMWLRQYENGNTMAGFNLNSYSAKL